MLQLAFLAWHADGRCISFLPSSLLFLITERHAVSQCHGISSQNWRTLPEMPHTHDYRVAAESLLLCEAAARIVSSAMWSLSGTGRDSWVLEGVWVFASLAPHTSWEKYPSSWWVYRWVCIRIFP